MTQGAPSKRRKTAVLTALALIGLIILMALAVPWYQKAFLRGKKHLIESNLQMLRKAKVIEQYEHDNKSGEDSTGPDK